MVIETSIDRLFRPSDTNPNSRDSRELGTVHSRLALGVTRSQICRSRIADYFLIVLSRYAPDRVVGVRLHPCFGDARVEIGELRGAIEIGE
jgi:hypothetical protein